MTSLRPRNYQWEVYERAKKSNVIAFLDTGSGKTLISVLLIKDKAEQLINRGNSNHIFFLAPKVELVKQQADVLRTHTSSRVGFYVGEMGIDAWGTAKWAKEFAKHDIFVCTPMILLNLLIKGFLKLDTVALIVFDECHHCKKNDPMNRIMKEFYFHQTLQEEDRPHIFGLTASPLDTKAVLKPGHVERFFDELEANLNAKIVTVSDQQEVKEAAPVPTRRDVWYKANNLVENAVLKHATDSLEKLHNVLIEEASNRRIEQNEMQPTIYGQLLDTENVTTETSIFAQTMGRLRHVLQEVGPCGLLVCFAEVLKPGVRSIYEELSRESKLQESLASVRKAELNMMPSEMDQDSWWQGKECDAATSRVRPELSRKESKSLCLTLAMAYKIIAELMTHYGYSGLTNLSEADLNGFNYHAMREHLCPRLQNLEKSIDMRSLTIKIANASYDGKTVVSPKVAALLRLLCDYKGACLKAQSRAGPPWSCIIFAQQKIVCLAITKLLKACKTSLGFLQSDSLMGYGGHIAALSHNSALQQRVLDSFRNGDLNVLVATAVAEEGLDICHCSLVIRFDLPPTSREYIQSRGRARAVGSQMALLLETGNVSHQACVQRAEMFEKEMLRTTKDREDLPGPDQVQSCSNAEALSVPLEDREYRVASTGAKITLASAKGLVYQYCAKLPSDSYTGQLRPRFSTLSGSEGYQTVVYLPSNCPVRQAHGRRQQKQTLAVSSACLEAVKQLHKARALNDHLIPESEPPAIGDDEFELGPVGTLRETEATRLCALVPKWPEVLRNRRSRAFHQEYHMYRVCFSKIGGSTKSPPESLLKQPMALLVPNKLHNLQADAVDIILDDGSEAHLEFQYVYAVTLDAEQQYQVRYYHNTLLHRNPSATSLLENKPPGTDAAAKKRVRELEGRQLFQTLADVYSVPSEPVDEVDLCPLRFYNDALAVAKAYEGRHGMLPGDPQDEERDRKKTSEAKSPLDSWQDLYASLDELCTEVEGGKASAFPARIQEVAPTKIGPQKVEGESNASKLIEEGVGLPSAGMLAVPLLELAGKVEIDYDALQFACSRPDSILSMSDENLERCMIMPIYDKTSRQLYTVVRKTNILLSTFIEHYETRWGLYGLDPNAPMLEVKPLKSKSKQTCHMCHCLCVVHPLSRDAYLAAKHVPRVLWWLHSLLNAHELREQLIPKPITKFSGIPTTLDVLEALMPKSCNQKFSYEKLEIIGDAFLKFDTTLHCVRAFPTAHEGQLHNVKIKLVCNKHLAKIATENLHLEKYIVVPNMYYRWDAGHSLPYHEVRRKSVADVVEAIIGAFYLAGGADEASKLIRRILLLPESTRTAPPRPIPAYSPTQGMALKLEQLLEYKFRDRQLLREACTHPSWKEETTACYQRLEFLGDAVIDIFVTKTLAERHKDIEPGMVSDIREAAVNNTRLACVAAAHRCHQALRYCSPQLMRDITSFVKLFDRTLRLHTPENELQSIEEGEVKASSRALSATYDMLTDHSYGLNMSMAPKAMADMVESLAGAVFIDSDCELAPVWEVLDRMLMPLPSPETVALHPVRVLMEKASKKHSTLIFQKHQRSDKFYDIHAFIDTYLIASAEGHQSTKSGKIAAARVALNRWDPDFDYRAAEGQAFEAARRGLALAYAAAMRKAAK